MRNPQVLLKQIGRAFCKVAHGYKGIGNGLSPKKTRYFTMKNIEVMARSRSALAPEVSKGHCAVYVGSVLAKTKWTKLEFTVNLIDKILINLSMGLITTWDSLFPVKKLISGTDIHFGK